MVGAQRGQADAESNAVYAKAYEQDPAFFAFTKALQFYADSLKASTTSLVTRPDSLYFDYDTFVESLGEKPAAK